jgi:membrane protein
MFPKPEILADVNEQLDRNSRNPTVGDAVESNRGCEAETPTEIPPQGWRDIFLRVKDKVAADNLSIIAAGVAFYGFLAIFPAIAAVVSAIGLITSPSELQTYLHIIESLLPSEAADLINKELQRIIQAQGSRLGWGAFGGTVLALWSAAKALSAMFAAMNVTYDEEEKRGFIRLSVTALLMTLGAILFVIVSLGLIVGVPLILRSVGIGEIAAALINYSRWPLLAGWCILFLAVLYRYGPSRRQPQWRWVTPGAIVTTLLWLVGSALFSFYVTQFASYNMTYGSLGVVVILMIWFFLSVYSILLGAEINAEDGASNCERYDSRETETVGASRSLRSRHGRRVASVMR